MRIYSSPLLKNVALYLVALRPRQWIKNLLIVAAPLAAEQFFQNILQMVLGLISFIFISSLGYVVNDYTDRLFDREHPKKKTRLFASGEFSFKHFIILIVICFSIATTPLIFLPSNFSICLLIYLFITLSYSFFIKHIPVLEMMWLSSGFLVRALAGSAIINQPPTGWFICLIFFGSMFMVSGKRLAEAQKSKSFITRKVVNLYSPSFLNTISITSLSITLITYCLWVFEVHPSSVIIQVSILTFTYTMMMYLFSSDSGDAEIPEMLLFSNRFLILGIITTLFLLLIGYYL
jgi:decaprenyl-phosphate phosphoribosyltransferase